MLILAAHSDIEAQDAAVKGVVFDLVTGKDDSFVQLAGEMFDAG